MRESGLAKWVAKGILLAAVGVAVAADQPSTREARRTPVVDVFERCRDAVVNISTTRVMQMRSRSGLPFEDFFDFGPPRMRNQRVQSVGSGAVIHESGYIVTNAHVVAQAADVQVNFADQETLPADVLAVDQEHDLAVVKVKAPRPLACLKLGRSDDIMIGETVIAIGNPLGLRHTVTAGIVSALDRDLQFSEDVVYKGLIQTDAPINPGNSGGPLLNVLGELIGINSAIRGDAQNIGFAIPVDRLWELLPSLLDIEHYQPVRFGVQVGGQNAEVQAVRADSPAAKAGLKKGDRVTEINGQALRDGIDYYVHLLDCKPDSDVRLKVQRDGKAKDIAVTLQSISPEDGAKLAEQLFGITLREVPASLRQRYELAKDVGLQVDHVKRGSPADRAGIRSHDVIFRLDGVTIRDLRGVGMLLERVEPGELVLVEGLREDARQAFIWQQPIKAGGSR